MKTTYRILLSSLLMLLQQKINAQASLSVFGLAAKEQDNIDCSRGFGFDWKSKSLFEFGKLVPYGDKKPVHSFQLRVGGSFYNTVLRKRVYENTRQIAPTNADMLVKSKVYGINFDLRISRAYFFRYVPYLDMFAGIRGFKGRYDYPNSFDKLYRNLNTSAGNIGCTIGMLYRIGSATFLDAGIIVTHSSQPCDMLDVNSGRYTTDGFFVDRVQAPKVIAQAKIGLTIEFNGVRSKKFAAFLTIQEEKARERASHIKLDSVTGRYYEERNGTVRYLPSGNNGGEGGSGDSDNNAGKSWGGNAGNNSGGSTGNSGSSGNSSPSYTPSFTPSGNNNSYSPADLNGGGKNAPGSNPQSPAPGTGNKGGG